MVSDVDRLDQKHKIKIWLQTFGGKVAGEFKGRGKAKGLMEYKDVTKSHGDIVKDIKDKIKNLIKTT